MDGYLPKDIQDGLDTARKTAGRQRPNLRAQMADGSWQQVVRTWDGGFSLDRAKAGQIRGLIDLYDGARHVSRCLIVASSQQAGEMQFEYKRITQAWGTQPLDFVRRADAPRALIEDQA